MPIIRISFANESLIEASEPLTRTRYFREGFDNVSLTYTWFLNGSIYCQSRNDGFFINVPNTPAGSVTKHLYYNSTVIIQVFNVTVSGIRALDLAIWYSLTAYPDALKMAFIGWIRNTISVSFPCANRLNSQTLLNATTRQYFIGALMIDWSDAPETMNFNNVTKNWQLTLAAGNFSIDPTFGETGTGSTDNAENGDYKDVSRFQCSDTGTISKLTLRCWGESGNKVLKGVVYADSSGSPGALLATSAEATALTGTSTGSWLDLTFSSPPSCTSGTYYFLGFICGTTSMGFRHQTNTGDKIWYNADTYVGGASDPFGSTSTSNNKHICIYATVSTSGLNLEFPLSIIPAISTTSYNWKALLKALSIAPAFTTSLRYGTEWFANLALIPTFPTSTYYGRALIRALDNALAFPSGITALRALMYPFETIPTYISDTSSGLGKIVEVIITQIPSTLSNLVAGRALAFRFSQTITIIADITTAMETGVTFVISIIPTFPTTTTIAKELFRSLSVAPIIIADLYHELELSFIEIILSETVTITAQLITSLAAAPTLDLAFALAALAFILAITALSMIFLKKHD